MLVEFKFGEEGGQLQCHYENSQPHCSYGETNILPVTIDCTHTQGGAAPDYHISSIDNTCNLITSFVVPLLLHKHCQQSSLCGLLTRLQFAEVPDESK